MKKKFTILISTLLVLLLSTVIAIGLINSRPKLNEASTLSKTETTSSTFTPAPSSTKTTSNPTSTPTPTDPPTPSSPLSPSPTPTTSDSPQSPSPTPTTSPNPTSTPTPTATPQPTSTPSSTPSPTATPNPTNPISLEWLNATEIPDQNYNMSLYHVVHGIVLSDGTTLFISPFYGENPEIDNLTYLDQSVTGFNSTVHHFIIQNNLDEPVNCTISTSTNTSNYTSTAILVSLDNSTAISYSNPSITMVNNSTIINAHQNLTASLFGYEAYISPTPGTLDPNFPFWFKFTVTVNFNYLYNGQQINSSQSFSDYTNKL